MELIILFFFPVIFSSEHQAQLFGPIIRTYKNPGNDADIELAFRHMESGIYWKIKDVGISPLKTNDNRTIGNISLCPLISGKVYI